MKLSSMVGVLVGVALLSFAAPPPLTVDSHRLNLKSFGLPAQNGPTGLLVPVRINHGPLLHLLLDSGAQFLVLDAKSAARSGCAGGATIDLVGAGGKGTRLAKTAKAAMLQSGSVVFHDLDIAITQDRVLDGIDGVMPLAIFSKFRIRLDIPAKILELTEAAAASVSAVSTTLLSNGLLFVNGSLNGVHEGLFLLDTGSSFNAISTKLARHMKSSSLLAGSIPVQSAIASMFATIVPEALHVRVGARKLRMEPAIAIDLSLASEYHNLEVSGLLGYPALRDSIVTVDYRDRLVQIERK